MDFVVNFKRLLPKKAELFLFKASNVTNLSGFVKNDLAFYNFNSITNYRKAFTSR